MTEINKAPKRIENLGPEQTRAAKEIIDIFCGDKLHGIRSHPKETIHGYPSTMGISSIKRGK